MKKIGFLFPGQGAQVLGMGKDFAEAFSVARETFEEADDILGFSLSQIIFAGPEEKLVETKYSQIAIFVTSIAILRVIQEQFPEIEPFVCAGLSLGEYSALCAAEKLPFKETLLLVQKRGELMQQSCEMAPGTMAVVLGLGETAVRDALKGVKGVWVANFNCPGQIVISGTKEGVAEGSEKLKTAGAKRVLPLNVSGAFHSGLMEMAKQSLEPYVLAANIQETKTSLVMNVPGAFVSGVEAIRGHLVSQVTESVRWESGILAMDKEGIDLYIEMGPGTTLQGMNRKIQVKGATLSVEKVADLEKVANALEKGCPCSS